jgi:hypothetical protein
MSDKLNKLLVVVFLTLLIWTWAFMSKAKERSFMGTLAVSPANPSLLVTFSLDENTTPQTEISLKSLNFTGAPSKLSDLQKRYTLPLDDPDVERLDFYYDPGERTGGTYTLDILDYLQKNVKVQELALSLESCNPSEITVNIEQLVEKELPIQCINKDSAPLKATCEPSLVKIFVRKEYNVESATVVLSPQQIETAGKEPVSAIPYVDLGVAGVKRKAPNPVQIKLQTEEQQLTPHRFITSKSIGIVMSQDLRERFKVTIENETKARETTTIYATAEAFKAYEEMTYPLEIEIKPSDVSVLSQIQLKKIIYNFPPEYVRKREIKLADQLDRQIEIKIDPINPPVTP